MRDSASAASAAHPAARPIARPLTRREALQRTAAGIVALATGACNLSSAGTEGEGNGRLGVRAFPPTRSTDPGLYPLGLGGSRDGLFYVPTSYRPDVAAPLALLLHGAGQEANELVDPMRALADDAGLVLVAPDSRGGTWDAIRGTFFDDVSFIDDALGLAFSRVRVDASRVRIVGFSDGGSYALSLGMINGDFFSRIAAFSPGFIIPRASTGKPKVFITHGTRDAILPIDQTSRRIVPDLEAAGYDVEYHEFDGGHGITPALLEQATAWIAGN